MLTLILQTSEGQQIELNVQPEDTFADLRLQYSDTEGLSESLEQLITNGATVDENTRIFDYVTSSAHEWFTAGQTQESDAQSLESMDPLALVKECCAQGCPNSEAVTPGKPFFPLPTDHERLTACLIEAGRLDLYSQVLDIDADSYQKYFLCGNHFAENSLPTVRAPEQASTISLLKPKNARIQPNANDEAKNQFHAVDSETKDSGFDVPATSDGCQHPGILCRLCGEITANPVHLYAEKENNSEYSLADKINLCLPVTVSVTDPLPKQICRDCQIKLNACHELAVSSLRTEDKLTLLLRENKLCTDGASEPQCPLCLEGKMQIVKRSGIYRKEDLQNDLIASNNGRHKTNSVKTDDNSKNSVIGLPSAGLSDDGLLPVPEGEFACSVCNESLTDVTAIRSHRCVTKMKNSHYSCVICNEKNFIHSHELEAHYRRHGISEKIFFCELCSYSCRELDDVTEHARTCRAEISQVHCNACGGTFPKDESTNGHECHSLSSDCLETKVKFSTELEAPTKSARKRQSIRYSCHFCDKRFARKVNLQKHISSTHNESSDDPIAARCYKCRKCNEAFVREADAAMHANVRHGLPSNGHDRVTEELTVGSLYSCEYCERCFTMPSSLHDHREAEHDKQIHYSCPTCVETFDSHKRLAAHKSLRSHHKPLDYINAKQLYLCKYCDKTFLHRPTLSAHVLQHRELAPYLCRPCGLNFETYREVATHRDVVHPYQSELHESSSRSYKCQYCGKLFSHEFVLVKHIRMHTGERPHKCSICGKGFSQSSGLYTHMKIHSDLRPYNCPSCPRTFKIKGDRNNHVKKHSGNRPYKCEFCSKAFMTQHVYSQHRRIHTNERPYKCEICGEAFRRSYVRTVHMRRHTGEKPHLCDLCPKTYRQRSDLVKHRKVQHGIIVNATSEIVFADERENDTYDSFSKSDNKIVENTGDCSMMLTL